MTDRGIDAAIPVRRDRFEERADGGVTVFVPRFTSRLARRLVLPLFARPEFRVQLDDIGSAVWRACDGRTTVAEIVLGLGARTGADLGELRGRVLQFLHRLAREGSIQYVTKEQA